MKKTLQYLGLIQESETALSGTPAHHALRNVHLLAAAGYLAIAFRVLLASQRAFTESQSVACTSVVAIDAIVAAVPVACGLAIATAIARGLAAAERRKEDALY